MRPPAPNRTLLRINLLDPSTICRQCTAQLRPVLRAPSHAPLLARRAVSTTPSSRLSASYFLPNNALERAAASAVKARTQSQSSRTSATVTNDSSSTTAATAKGSASTSRLDATQPPVNAELPHRRRQAARRAAAAAEAEADSGSSSSSSAVLPAQDASSALTTVAASQPARSLRRILSACLSLSKPRLTVLVVLTAMLPSLSPLTLLFLTTGTTLCSASANALNMLYEPATDAKMSRTRNRPLVRNIIAPRVALLFALVGAAGGIGALYFGVNPTVAFLGAANIVLYAGVYTPLKRVTALNTWIGAVAFRFWRAAGHAGTARGLFWASVWHLPVVLGLATLQKKGMWSRVWASLFGAPHDDDDDEEWDELDETPAPLLPPRKA
ncbi:Ras GTPase-activating-like protein rng2 [Verticillium dahliae VDG2]|nr:Ras GTPase-activating-like protein rng2 [Verticillium dahliae VDG2]